MAVVLSEPDRDQVNAEFQTAESLTQQSFGALTKQDIRAAVAAIDDWVLANQAAFNTAIPQPARGVLTTKQKSSILTRVVRRRYDTAAY